MYGLAAAYSIPESSDGRTDTSSGNPAAPFYSPYGGGRWFLSFLNPDGTHTGMWSNTNALADPHFVDPPDSVWAAMGVLPIWKTNPSSIVGDIKPADFYAANPINPASMGPAIPAAKTPEGAPAVLGLRTEGAPSFNLPGTSVEIPSLPWWVWGVGAAGVAWFAFGRGK